MSSAACFVGLVVVVQPELVVEVAEVVVVEAAVAKQSWVEFAEPVAAFAVLAVAASWVVAIVGEVPSASVVVPFVAGPSVAALDPTAVVQLAVHVATVAFVVAAFAFEASVAVVVVESAQVVAVVVVVSSVVVVLVLLSAAGPLPLPYVAVAAERVDLIAAAAAVAKVLVYLQQVLLVWTLGLVCLLV